MNKYQINKRIGPIQELIDALVQNRPVTGLMACKAEEALAQIKADLISLETKS